LGGDRDRAKTQILYIDSIHFRDIQERRRRRISKANNAAAATKNPPLAAFAGGQSPKPMLHEEVPLVALNPQQNDQIGKCGGFIYKSLDTIQLCIIFYYIVPVVADNEVISSGRDGPSFGSEKPERQNHRSIKKTGCSVKKARKKGNSRPDRPCFNNLPCMKPTLSNESANSGTSLPSPTSSVAPEHNKILQVYIYTGCPTTHGIKERFGVAT
jgi:hypothetical protein